LGGWEKGEVDIGGGEGWVDGEGDGDGDGEER